MPKKVTNSFSFVYSGRPESYNAKKRGLYKKNIASTYNRHYQGQIVSGDLYAIVYYFYSEDRNLDADNLSKPLWDALTGVAYPDDKLIKIRSVVSIDLRKYEVLDFDQDNISSAILYDLFDSIENNDHTLFIQVGTIENYTNIFNICKLWN